MRCTQKRTTSACIAILLLLCVTTTSSLRTHPIDETSFGSTATNSNSTKIVKDSVIQQLFREVRQRQWNDSQPAKAPFQFGHEVGKYQNDVHFNYVGDPTHQFLRNKLAVADDNMFVTSFVLESVFEALLLAPELVTADDWSATAAINATVGLRDKNIPDTTTPIFGFWPQKLMINDTVGNSWEQWPINLANFPAEGVKYLEIFGDIAKYLGVKIEDLWKKYGVPLEHWLSGLDVLFQIPSDADDSSVVMGLERYLTALKTELPNAKALWDAQHFNNSKAFDVFEKYSYCINSNKTDKNTIDPRTYMWAHKYLNNISDVDECIVTTWMQSISESRDIALLKRAGPNMPLNVNNLDPTVGANALYAMSTSLLSGQTEWFKDPIKRKLYIGTAKFVTHALSTQTEQKRPDLELLYYPPELNIVWFVARHVKALESYLSEHQTTSFPFPEMDQVYSMLSEAVRGPGMDFLMWHEVHFGSECGLGNSTTNDDVACWDGFLGQADTDGNGTHTPHYEDRYCNTAVAVVAMLDAFTYTDSTMRKIQWVEPSPHNKVDNTTLSLAKRLVRFGVHYLQAALAENATVFENAFFSGSGKYWEQYQFWYPANLRFDWQNNQTINCSAIDIDQLRQMYFYSVFGASGKITDAEFDKMVHGGCAGVVCPTWFTGYNGEKAYPPPHKNDKAWPYWSAPVLSYAVGMQALVKYRALENQ